MLGKLIDEYPSLKVALENQIGDRAGVKMHGAKWEELDFLRNSLDNKQVGYCLDTGHAMTSGLTPDQMALCMGSSLLTTHLHDNHGLKDEHLLPGEGLIDWKRTIREIIKANPAAPLVLELNPRTNKEITVDGTLWRAELGRWHERLLAIIRDVASS